MMLFQIGLKMVRWGEKRKFDVYFAICIRNEGIEIF